MKCVCTVISKDFIPGFRAMVNSIKMHTKGFDENFLCLDIDLGEDDRKLCKEIYHKCQFVQPDKDNYRVLPPHTRPLKNAFFKLEFFKIAQRYDRMIFIDSDMIFLNSIQELLNMKPRANLGLAFHTSHQEYNTGLILFDRLPPIIYKRIMDLLHTIEKAHLADQGVIMEAIKKNLFSVNRLPWKWNTTKRQAKQYKGRPRDYIGLHFVGKKPWKGGEDGYKDLEDIWHKYSEGYK